MWILPLLGYLGIVLGFGFLTLAIASGLYYLSELVEEHTVFAKKLLTRLIYAVITIQLLLVLLDRFPIGLSALSIVSHVVYLGNMSRFPVVKLSSPLFIASCVLVLANHYLWFRHFSNLQPPTPRSRFEKVDFPSFTEVASYFGICVWLVPFALFVSLSANDSVLPTMNSEDPVVVGGSDTRTGAGRQGMAKVVVDLVRDGIGNAMGAVGLDSAGKTKGF